MIGSPWRCRTRASASRLPSWAAFSSASSAQATSKGASAAPASAWPAPATSSRATAGRSRSSARREKARPLPFSSARPRRTLIARAAAARSSRPRRRSRHSGPRPEDRAARRELAPDAPRKRPSASRTCGSAATAADRRWLCVDSRPAAARAEPSLSLARCRCRARSIGRLAARVAGRTPAALAALFAAPPTGAGFPDPASDRRAAPGRPGRRDARSAGKATASPSATCAGP